MNAEERQRLQTAVLQSQANRRAKVEPTPPQGLTFRPDGRSGFIYYRVANRVLEIYAEMSGVVARYDMRVWPEALDACVFPGVQPLTADERIAVRSQFSDWLRQQRFKTDYQ